MRAAAGNVGMTTYILTIEIDNYTGHDALAAKEAVAARLEPLGSVRVVDVKERRPKQISFQDGEYRYE